MERFEQVWSTSHVIGMVNDGEEPANPGPDPKTRCLAFLADLRSGAQPSATESIEMEGFWCEGLDLPFGQMLAHVRTEYGDNLQEVTA